MSQLPPVSINGSGDNPSTPTKVWLIDDRGELWDERSAMLRGNLHATTLETDFADYVVRNLGFVYLASRAASFRVRLKPQTLSPVAFTALIHVLTEQRVERILVSHHGDDWQHQFYNSLEVAIRGMVALLNAAEPPSSDFLRKPLAVDRLEAGTALADLLRAWRAAGDTFDRERLGPLLEGGLAGRFVVMLQSRAVPGFRLGEVGTGLAREAGFWLTRAVGLRVEDQPDTSYGRWVATTYNEVMSEGAPRLEAVDATIRWPRIGPRRHCYQRLLLPFGTDGDTGDAVLLSAPVADGRIDLRRDAG